MKLKEKLAVKYCKAIYSDDNHGLTALQNSWIRKQIEDAYITGFDRAKELYIDYAKRFLTDPNLKPGQEHEKLFQKVGEQRYAD